jgi:hypothetical protein
VTRNHPSHPAQRERGHFTRLSDDCPICRLMEQLDREGLLEEVVLDEDDEQDPDTSVFKMPQIVPFDRMSVSAAQALLSVLPPAAPAREGEPPSLAEMIAVAERCPGMLLQGYRVDPGGPVDHVLLEGFYVPLEYTQQVRDAFARRPEGWEALAIGGKPYWRAWWA